METKKTVVLVVVYLAVLAACVVVTGAGKHNDVRTGIRTFPPANEGATGHAGSMPDDPEYGNFDCVLAEDKTNIIVLYTEKEDSNEFCKISIVEYQHEYQSDPGQTSIAGYAGKMLYSNKAVYCPIEEGQSVPVTDLLVSEDKLLILMVDGCDLALYEKKLSDNKYDFADWQCVYRFLQHPFLFNGHLTQAVFITPDIIRIGNSVGAVMHYRIDHGKANYVKDKNGKVIGMPDMTEDELREREKIPIPHVNLIWWNGVGSKEAATGLRPGDECEISSTEPAYINNSFAGWTRMDQKTKTAMQERVEKYAVAMKIPREILMKKDGKVISLKIYPYYGQGRHDDLEYVY